MDARRTPDAPVPGVPRHTPDPTLERGYVASLRWLVAEGEARGLRRLAVELCALREALTTLDETRRARDEQAERAALLDREIQDAQRLLGDATHVNGNGSLVARLTRLREILGQDVASRKALVQERDTWRAMCELQTRTRAMVHALLEESERACELLESEVVTLREHTTLLATAHNETATEAREQREKALAASAEVARLEQTSASLSARVASLEQERARLIRLRDRLSQVEPEQHIEAADAQNAAGELAELRSRLHGWSSTVERALEELARLSGSIGLDRDGSENASSPPTNPIADR